MNNMKPIDTNEIAQQLDCGFRVLINKKTGELLLLPADDKLDYIDLDDWAKDFEMLENNEDDYFEFEMWSSHESFEVMEAFANQLDENEKLQNELLEALRRRKPFREFKFVIDNSGDYRQQWFDFKNKWQEEYVKKQIPMINQSEE